MTVIQYTKNVLYFVWNHPANRRQRIRSVLRAITFQLRGRVLRRRTIASLGKESIIWADLHRKGASKVVYGNPPDYQEMITWRRFLKSGNLFLDVGANVGSYAIWAAELGAEVIALEPADDTFALLRENVALNRYNISIIRAAAGATCGSARFTSGRDCVNRLDPRGSVETEVVTIDSVIGNRLVHGMKVDVEGFEIDVLRGCEKALSEHRINLIQLEWNATSLNASGSDRQPVMSLLAKHGYTIYRPTSDGERLVSVTDASFGGDVFARPN